jgi:tetratricopeptide (TPR) repeat protein
LLDPPWAQRLGPPTFLRCLLPAVVVALLVFGRSPASNYIFDEQEALLANPFVTGQVPWGDVFRVDFWGLPPHRTIGSYRPLPNLIWRALWHPALLPMTPWILHLANVVGHAAVSAGLAAFAYRFSGQRLVGWAVGAGFLLTAVLTEAVSGVVGLADILGGAGVVLALHALRLPLLWMPPAVFAALCLGLGGKESVIASLPLVGAAALASAPRFHGQRAVRWSRAVLALAGALLAVVAYTSFRKDMFPAAVQELGASAPNGWTGALLRDFLAWFGQPKLPRDPMNNPLFDAPAPARVAAALRVYLAGLLQVVFPWNLSGDYSFPQITAVGRGWRFWLPMVCGLVCLAAPAAWGSWALVRRNGGLFALGLLWVPLAFLPHSNLLVLLPTVRAERFWYLPAMGSALCLGVGAARLVATARPARNAAVVAFLLFQALQARAHALHYSDDLVFWRATRIAAPKSAKAHLNYAVMVGARGDLAGRFAAGQRALELAPEWAMAHAYQGDVLCRLGRLDEAWHHYVRGFVLDPRAQNQIALALQCLWDRGAVDAHRDELRALGEQYRGTWLGYLASDLVHNGEVHGGVDPQYRARGYNPGPEQPSGR